MECGWFCAIRRGLTIAPDGQSAGLSAGGNWEDERQTNGCDQNSNNQSEGYCVWEMPLPSRVEPGHLQPDKNQDERQAITQQAESRKGEKKIDTAKAQNGKYVRCVDDQRLGGDRKDSRNGIDGEKNVGRLDKRGDQQNRRSVQFSIPSQEEICSFRVRRHGQQPS